MKKLLLVPLILTFGSEVFSQSEIEPETKPKKIETIRIIDGDTVMHDVRIVERSAHDRHGEMRREFHHKEMTELDEEIETILEDLDVYIHLDDERGKKMIIHRLERSDADVDEILEEINGEDIVIDMQDGHQRMKIIKIEIDEESGEEIADVEVKRRGKKGHHPHHGKVMMDKDMDFKVFPNPTKDILNIEFEVEKGEPGELSVVTKSGDVLLEKTYQKEGKQKETINLKDTGGDMVIVQYKQGNRIIKEKILVH